MLFKFEEGNLSYQLRYFLTNLLEDDFTDSMVRVHLFASLQRAGIRVAEPQRTVHAITRDEAHAETVRKRELVRRLEILRGIDLFAGLSDDEKEEIAERLQYAPFARGDVIGAPRWISATNASSSGSPIAARPSGLSKSSGVRQYEARPRACAASRTM